MKRWILFLLLSVSCYSTESAYQQYEKLAEQFNESSFQEALQKEGLTLTPAPPHVEAYGTKDESLYYAHTNSYDPAPEFAKDKDGKLYRVIRSPQWSEQERFSLFGCPPVRGGAMVKEMIWAYEGVSGEKTISYQAKVATAEYSIPADLWTCTAPP